MQEFFIQHKTIGSAEKLKIGEYENCIFNALDCGEMDLSNFKFTNCTFNACNLSLCKINNTVFSNVVFKDCKMLGLRLDDCNEFGLSFTVDSCQLNHSSFLGLKLKKMIFKNCQLVGVDFSEADLSAVVFEECNLSQAIFDRTNLEKADFRTAVYYTLDLEKNKVKKAKFSAAGLIGLLGKYDIVIEN